MSESWPVLLPEQFMGESMLRIPNNMVHIMKYLFSPVSLDLYCIAIPSTEYLCDHQTLNL